MRWGCSLEENSGERGAMHEQEEEAEFVDGPRGSEGLTDVGLILCNGREALLHVPCALIGT